MFIHTNSDSINLTHISSICWSLGVENNGMVDTVVCVSLVSGDELYLYYQDEDELKAIQELKDKVCYPYDLPTLEDTVRKPVYKSN